MWKKRKNLFHCEARHMTYKPIVHNNRKLFENEVVSAQQHRSSKGINIVWNIHSLCLDIHEVAWNVYIYTGFLVFLTLKYFYS